MRIIIALLYKYSFVLLFILLQGVSFALLFRYNHYQHASAFNSSSQVVGWFMDVGNSISEPFRSIEENRRLMEENAELRELQISSYRPLSQGKIVVEDTVYEQQYSYIPGQVINSFANKQQNYITINVGRNDGAAPGMGVIGKEGIVGFIKDVSDHYAVVVPVINGQFQTSVKHVSSGNVGNLSWDGVDPDIAQITTSSRTVTVHEGDEFITTGFTKRYPTGIPVGEVSKVEELPGGERDIHIDLYTDYRNLYHIYVVNNKFKKEQQSLEDGVVDNDQ